MMIFNRTFNLNFKYIIFCSFFYVARHLYFSYLLEFNLYKHIKFLQNTDLKIHTSSLTAFGNNYKKNRHCVLLISGFKDTPLVWHEFTKLLDKANITWFSPRMAGCGRTFYQIVNSEDWFLTYFEAMKILENLFDEVTVIGFSTGCVIASKLLDTELKWKCTINKFIMLNPFFMKQDNIPNFIVSNYYTNFILSLFFPFIPKTITYPFTTVRDTFNVNELDYYENIYNVNELFQLFEFINFRPKSINSKSIVIIYSTHDFVIGNIDEQFKIFNNIHNNVKLVKCPIESGHVILKENSDVLQFLFNVTQLTDNANFDYDR